MKLESTNNTLLVSEWNKFKFRKFVLPVIIGSLFFYFIQGIGSAILVFIFCTIASIIGGVLENVFHYAIIKFDFLNHKITVQKKIFGIKFGKKIIDNVDFNKLSFETFKYKRSPKYLLDYTEKDKEMTLYRVNKEEERDLILEELNKMTLVENAVEV